VTHLPFIAAAYALGLLVPAAFAAGAWRRTRAAERRLAAVDPRRNRGEPR
jgi:cytochrome c biogenesis protein CcdA